MGLKLCRGAIMFDFTRREKQNEWLDAYLRPLLEFNPSRIIENYKERKNEDLSKKVLKEFKKNGFYPPTLIAGEGVKTDFSYHPAKRRLQIPQEAYRENILILDKLLKRGKIIYDNYLTLLTTEAREAQFTGPCPCGSGKMYLTDCSGLSEYVGVHPKNLVEK